MTGRPAERNNQSSEHNGKNGIFAIVAAAPAHNHTRRRAIITDASVINGRMTLRYLAVMLAIASSLGGASRLSEALDLEAKGNFQESKALLRAEIDESRARSDSTTLARALSAFARISVSLGAYKAAIQSAEESIGLQNRLKQEAALSEDYNTLGLANLYLGNYDAALDDYRKALDLDRRHQNVEAQVTRQNNIGNVFYYRGRYQEALRAYQQAMDALSAAAGQSWVPRRRQLTIANLAAVYQRIGKDQTALAMYRQMAENPQALPRAEYAQLLLNEGVLYRRLGDPVKALESYRSAQSLFATERHRDGEIRALQNIGIVRALDFSDLDGALTAFTDALDLAQRSSDTRGITQATLYRAEVLRRQGNLRAGADDLRLALAGAEKAGLAEERWRALYGLGQFAETEGNTALAADYYRKGIDIIESVRAGIRRVMLRNEFLGDKRQVYDSLVALELRQAAPPLDAIFSLMEQSRARAFEERTESTQRKHIGLSELRSMLPKDTVFIEFWTGEAGVAELWITRSAVGLAKQLDPAGGLRESVAKLSRALRNGDAWQESSRDLGRQLLTGIPRSRHILATMDGPLADLPLEVLTAPDSGRILIEDSDVTYLPAARFFEPAQSAVRWAPPWRTQLLAFGDPPASDAAPLGEKEQWQPLAASKDEIESIAALLPGRSETHLGASARKRDLLSRPRGAISLLHFSTHAVVDDENPDRSRIVMASDSPSAGPDYLFQQEVYGLNLKGVDLATISACETARGKIVRGDGAQAFTQAFLAAGAAATVTSLWRVADLSTAAFMKQFYYFLSRGQTKSEALRLTKLQFLRSHSRWAAPQYWAAFVLNGDGWDTCVRFISWIWFVTIAALLILSAAASVGIRQRTLRARKTPVSARTLQPK